jgi:hypothetical protein
MSQPILDRRRNRSRAISPDPERRPKLTGGASSLSPQFLAAMQQLLWPELTDERERPANLLSFESTMGPIVRVDQRQATVGILAVILRLRKVAIDRRADETPTKNPDDRLSKEEMGWVMEWWKQKFNEQTLTKQQAARDKAENCNNNEKRHRMRSRFYSYQHRTLGNRTLGIVLITYGFKVNMRVLSDAYHEAVKNGDASSSPSADLRKRTLSARAWFRWGKQIDNHLKSNQESGASLGTLARSAWQGYISGWSGENADNLTKKYGHGMLRTGNRRGRIIGQGARGSVADRMREAFPVTYPL